MVDIWNTCVEYDDSKPIEPRERLFASELGGSMVDIFLKLKGTTPTNPPNNRSRRKFNAGNVTEWIVKAVLLQAGILLETQKPFGYQYDGLLPVSGRLDFIMGGRPDYNKAISTIGAMKHFPPFVTLAMEKVIEELLKTVGDDELKPMVLEVKSKASRMMEMIMRTEKPQYSNVLQTFHYLKSSEGLYDEGRIIYVCRDDLHCIEFPVFNPSDVEVDYYDFIKEITGYYQVNQQPPLEPEIKFEDFRFRTNWKVEYSPFLTMLYGYSRPELYRDKYKKMVSSFNHTYKRIINDDKMTKLNLDTIEEMKKVFPNLDELVQLGKTNKEALVEEEEESLV